jgi:hypothetical protein
MKKPQARKLLNVPKPARYLTVILAALLSANAWAGFAGQITHLSGVISAKRTDGATKVLALKSEVQEGDVLTTEDETYARVKFTDGGEVVIRPNSQLKITSYQFQETEPQHDNIAISMLKGGFRAVTGLLGKRSRDKVSFGTSTATIGIRGTHFGALLCQGDCAGIPTVTGKPPADGLHVDVVVGAVSVTNSAGQVQLNAGQFGYVPGPTTPPTVVPPQQGIQVTMPASIAQNKGAGRGVGKTGESECKM